jgi:hypothetical protein
MDTVARAAAYVNIGTNSLNLVDTFLWPLIALRHASALLCFIRKRPHVPRRTHEAGRQVSHSLRSAQDMDIYQTQLRSRDFSVRKSRNRNDAFTDQVCGVAVRVILDPKASRAGNWMLLAQSFRRREPPFHYHPRNDVYNQLMPVSV